MSKTERSVETRFKKLIKDMGLLQVKLQRLGVPGWPDRMVVVPNGGVVFVELKRPGGVTTKLQDHVHDQLRALGHAVGVYDDAVKAADFVRGAMYGAARIRVPGHANPNEKAAEDISPPKEEVGGDGGKDDGRTVRRKRGARASRR